MNTAANNKILVLGSIFFLQQADDEVELCCFINQPRIIINNNELCYIEKLGLVNPDERKPVPWKCYSEIVKWVIETYGKHSPQALKVVRQWEEFEKKGTAADLGFRAEFYFEEATEKEIKEMNTQIDEVLKERGARYGAFEEHARISQAIKKAFKDSPNWERLTDSMKECLEMQAHKFARILNGDFYYLDSWIDCIGYLQLVVNELEKKDKV